MKNFLKVFIYLSFIFFVPFIYLALINFGGNKIYYIFFTIISFFSVFYSFREKGFFFEKFFSIYLWLGFWLKFTLFQSLFIESPPGGLGYFKFSQANLNELMFLASIPFVSLTFCSILITKFYQPKKVIQNNFWPKIYKNFRLLILVITIFFISVIYLINFKFGIYQKGLVSNIDLPLLVSGFFKWFYLMGSGVIISMLIKYELENKNDVSNSLYLLLTYESFVSNISLLSRAMIFNISAIFYAIFKIFFDSDNINKIKKLLIHYLIIVILFLASIPIINQIREKAYFLDEKILEEKTEVFGKVINEDLNLYENFNNNEIFLKKKKLSNTFYKALQLVYIRFVGIESLMAVSSYEDKNFDNFKEAFNEKIDYSNYNYYYVKYVLIGQNNTNEKFLGDRKDLTSNQYTIHVPGIVSFLYYSGSKTFIFFSIFLIGIIFFIFERFVYYSSSGNLILTAFISHIISYRLAHFGYVPTQSYLFFGSLLLTIFIIFLFNKLIK